MLLKVIKNLLQGGRQHTQPGTGAAQHQDQDPIDFLMTPEAVEDAIDNAEQLIRRSEYAAAAELLDQILVASPRNPRAIACIARNSPPYSADFYATWLPGMLASGDAMLGRLFGHHVFDRVIDFGAGAGAWLTAAGKHGAGKLRGLEGDWVQGFSSDLIAPSIEYRFGDLNDDRFLDAASDEPFDLAICVEVAEHILPSQSEKLVRAVCNAAPTVVFGAALPRQWGNGHVNCHSQRFWIDLFALHGYRCVDFFRPHFWFHTTVQHWYAQNTFLFVSDQTPTPLKEYRPSLLLDAYHPGTVNRFVLEDHRRGKADLDEG